MSAVDGLSLPMTVAVTQNAQRPVFLVNSLDLVGDERRRLIPGDADILALAPVLRIALALGVPVHALERVQDAVGRIDALLVGDLIGRKQTFQGRAVLHAVFVKFVLPQFFFGVPLRVMMGTDPDDLSILHVDRGDLPPLGKRALRESLQNSLVFDPKIALAFLRGPHRGPPLKTLPPNSNVAGGVILRAAPPS